VKLRDLYAEFVGGYHGVDTGHDHVGFSRLGDRVVDGVQGILFQCPKCAEGLERGEETDEDGTVRHFVRGAHSILCWFTNPVNAERVPDDADPKPGRWTFSGTSIDDITFIGPAAASVLLTGGCGWHGFVNNGEAA